MHADEDRVRITVTVDAITAGKIEELAGRMNASQSRMASWLLEESIQDNEWIIKVVTSSVMQGLREALRRPGRSCDSSEAAA